MKIHKVLLSAIAALSMTLVGCQKNDSAPTKTVDMPAPKLESSLCKDSQRLLLALETPTQIQVMSALIQMAQKLSPSELEALTGCLDQILSIECSFEKKCSIFEKENL